MKREDFILALISEANNPQNFLTHGHKNSEADLETDQLSPNNRSITPVIVDSCNEKHTQGNKADDVEMTWRGYSYKMQR